MYGKRFSPRRSPPPSVYLLKRHQSWYILNFIAIAPKHQQNGKCEMFHSIDEMQPSLYPPLRAGKSAGAFPDPKVHAKNVPQSA